MKTIKNETGASAAFRLSSLWVDALVFGLLLGASVLDLRLSWQGVFASAVLCLFAYVAAWEVCRWLIARGYALHESMGTTLAALVVGFAWYLPYGYDSGLEIARWVEVALTLGLMMEALMVSIALIGVLTSRQVRPLLELGLALAAGLAPGLAVVPAVVLGGHGAAGRLTMLAIVAAALLWFGCGRKHLSESAKHSRDLSLLDAAAGTVALIAVALIIFAGRYLGWSLGILFAAAVGAVVAAMAARALYDRVLLPREVASEPELLVRFLGARVVDRFPELCLLAAVFLAVVEITL